MNILFVTRGYPTSKYVTNGIFEWEQAKALHDLGNNIVYLAIDTRSIRKLRKLRFHKIIKEGITIYNISFPISKFGNKITDKIIKNLIEKAISKIENDGFLIEVIHSHFYNISYLLSLTKKKNDVLYVTTEHASAMLKENIDIKTLSKAKKAYDYFDLIISVSDDLKNNIFKYTGYNSIYIPNVITSFEFSTPVKKDKFVFITIGNFVEIKQMSLLVRAFNCAFEQEDEVELLIIGSGVKYKEISDTINKFKLNNKIKILGFKSRQEVYDLLSYSDAFVLVSKSETFGVSYLEAMFVGRPVIATKYGGPKHFVNNTNGITVDTINENAVNDIANAMINLKLNYNKFNLEQISSDARSTYSREIVASKIIEAYLNYKN